MPKSNQRILVHGSIAIDYIMDFDDNLYKNCSVNEEKKEFEMTVMPNTKKVQFGGTAGNISYNLGLLGANCEVLTSVGRDFETSWYKKKFSTFKNIKLNLIEHSDGFCANCYIVNDINKQQLIIYHGGVTQRIPEKNLKERGISAENFSWAINSPENPQQMINVSLELYKLGINTILDPGQVTPAFTGVQIKNMISQSNILICNEHEFNMVKDKTGLKDSEIIDKISSVIITKGAKGSILKTLNGETLIPIVEPERVVDPTGAGDGYRAGLIMALSQGLPVEYGCKVGATVGSFVVETKGGQSHVFNKKQFKERFERTFGTLELEL